MAMKQPMTGGWNPICVHGPSPSQPISVNHRLFSQRKCMIRLAIARTVDAEVGSMHVHGMRRVAGIDPPPAHWLVRGVSEAFSVRPGFTIDHGDLVGGCIAKVGSAPPQGDHKNSVGGRTAWRVHDERPSQLTVFAKRSAMVATCQIAA